MTLKGWSIGVVVFIVLLELGYGAFVLAVSWPVGFGNVDKAGVFGDSFGVLTSLFSGLAFAGIILTIFLQREELQLQRNELKLTREELANQNATFKRQNFESTFFQMLRLHNDIVNGIDLRHSNGNITKGRDCFATFSDRIHRIYRDVKKGHPEYNVKMCLDSAYSIFWPQHQAELGHYFRFLYTIFKFIKEHERDNKQFYSNVVRAQLSDQELLILFYNCLCKFGVEKFKPIVEEFALFDNLPRHLVIEQEHISSYAPSAFGKDGGSHGS